MSYTTWVEIDRAALLDNVRAFRRLLGPARFMAVVKGNAYGHGMVEVARALHDHVDWFGVNALDEANGLRDAGVTRPVLIMGATAPERLGEVVRGGFRQVVYDCEGAARLAQAAEVAAIRASVHLEVETGTNRLGARQHALLELAAMVRQQPSLVLEGMYSHYANVEDTLDGSYAEHQLQRFRDGIAAVAGPPGAPPEPKAATSDGIPGQPPGVPKAGTPGQDDPPPVLHTAATAAGILYPPTHFDMVRVGIGLYGLWPSAETEEAARRAGVELTLRPVLSWKARLVHLNDVPFGEPVGYGCTYIATRPRRIAVLPVGYYEGFDRSLSNRGRVLVRGCVAPVVGRVAMNMCMVDVTDIPGVALGDEAVIIGRQGERALRAEDMAALLDTINYEVVTRISPSLPRVWV